MSPFDLRSRPLLFLFLIFGRLIGSHPPTSTWFSIAVEIEEKPLASPWAFHSFLSKSLSPLVWLAHGDVNQIVLDLCDLDVDSLSKGSRFTAID
ncbi:hypothetical protein Goklo_006810, partial [Gossypium klotzschianum]|nr:hypothetical protein [Gossypium klotzschianum]